MRSISRNALRRLAAEQKRGGVSIGGGQMRSISRNALRRLAAEQKRGGVSIIIIGGNIGGQSKSYH